MLKAVLSAKDSMSPALKTIAKNAQTTRKYLLDVGSSAVNLAGHIGMPLGLISGALAAFSVAGIKQAVTAFALLGDEVVKSAKRIGVSTDEYQRIKYVAGQSGVAAEELGASMGKLNKNIAEAAAGKNKDFLSLMNKLQISLRGSNGELRAGVDILPELAEAFKRNQGAAIQARMGNTALSKSWQTLAPLLNGGREGIDQLNERYKMLGISVEENALVAGEAFGDQMDDLRQVMGSYGNTITAKLLPVLSPLLEKTIEWAVANRALITTRVSGFINDIAVSLSKVDWDGVIAGVGNFVNGVRSFIGWIGGARNALILLAVVINAQTLVALFGLVGALGRAGLAFVAMAAKAYLAGNTSLLAMARVGIVALATAGPLGILGMAFTSMAGLAAGAGGIISGAMGAVTLAIRGVGAAMMANPLGMILGLATAAVLIWQNWETLKGWFGGFFDWIGEKFQSLLGWARDLVKLAGGIFGGGDAAAAGGGASLSAFDLDAPVAGGGQPSLVGAAQVRASGKIEVSFKDAPPGMRVEQVSNNGDVPVNADVGYRSFATGMAY